MHQFVTVMVDRERTASEQIAEMMAPFKQEQVETYRTECWRDADQVHDEICCGGSGRVMADHNPRGEWDYYMESPPWPLPGPGEVTFSILLPGEGWCSREQRLPWGDRAPENKDWDRVFEAAVRRYREIGYDPVVVDYHC